MDNESLYYCYKWHAGEWGERIQNYRAELRIVEIEIDKRCLVQWSSTFFYHEDALSQFYQNGFDALAQTFGTPIGSSTVKKC
jgi:hypothetical protein